VPGFELMRRFDVLDQLGPHPTLRRAARIRSAWRCPTLTLRGEVALTGSNWRLILSGGAWQNSGL
jgi:hypothetical protein